LRKGDEGHDTFLTKESKNAVATMFDFLLKFLLIKLKVAFLAALLTYMFWSNLFPLVF
jgi:hypothetical protein